MKCKLYIPNYILYFVDKGATLSFKFFNSKKCFNENDDNIVMTNISEIEFNRYSIWRKSHAEKKQISIVFSFTNAQNRSRFTCQWNLKNASNLGFSLKLYIYRTENVKL